jgi:hypothetical protein
MVVEVVAYIFIAFAHATCAPIPCEGYDVLREIFWPDYAAHLVPLNPDTNKILAAF